MFPFKVTKFLYTQKTEMTITAEEARILVQKYNPNLSKELAMNKVLNDIYSKIKFYAVNGMSRFKKQLNSCDLEYKEDIRSILMNMGYKVKFKRVDSYRDYEDYIIISWDT